MKAALALLVPLAAAAAGCAAAGGAPAGTDVAVGGPASVALGERARFGAVAATPVRVEEDSRCPAEVQCIQAGTVRLAVLIEDRGARNEEVLALDRPHRLDGGGWLTLAAVCPYPRRPGPIRPASYRFTFAFGAAAPAPPLDFACPEG